MPDKITFRSLSISNFRGFREFQQFDLSGSAIILSGPNGTGKTSFFDAIQWLVLGDIERLAELKVHMNDEYILNEYSTAREAAVEATLELGLEEVWIARAGRARGNTLQLRVGQKLYSDADAENRLAQLLIPKGKMELKRLLMTSALLQQDVMRYFLQAKPRERYEHLNQLLGLNRLATFEDQLQADAAAAATEANRAREEELKSRQERQGLQALALELQAKQDQLGAVESAEESLSQAISRNAALVYVPGGSPSGLEGARTFFAELRSLRRRITEMELASSRFQAELNSIVPTDPEEVVLSEQRVAEFTNNVQQLEGELSGAATALEHAEQRSQAFAKLAASALPLLTNVCPVCGQDIDKSEIARRLQGATGDVAELARLRQVNADLDRQLDAARRSLKDAQAQRANISARQARSVTLRSQMEDLRKEAASIQETSSLVKLRLDLPAAEGMADARNLARALRELEETVERIVLVFASQESAQLRETRARVDEMLSLEPARTRRVEELAEREANAKRLLRATKDARVSVVRRRISGLQPLFTDIFARLDPHPSFKLLDLAHEVYRAQGTTVPLAIDPVEDKTANPMLVFSTSQANITALSLFLSLSLATGQSALPFILLDDPLQSLDDVNVLGFADLCRFIREERQLILSTHDRRFADLLERKLAPRMTEQRTRAIRFTGWDRSGPATESHNVDPELGLPSLLSA